MGGQEPDRNNWYGVFACVQLQHCKKLGRLVSRLLATSNHIIKQKFIFVGNIFLLNPCHLQVTYEKLLCTLAGLAAASDVVGVTLGGILGHALCTGAAVLGGKHLAMHINERMVALSGGLLFLAFAAHSLYTGPPTD